MDDSFQLLPRFPLQWLAAASLFLTFLLSESRFPPQKTGAQAALIWTVFSVHTLVFSLLRADQRPEWLGVYWDIWFLILCLLWAIIWNWIVFFRKASQEQV
jgi:hypothetical protein